MKARGSEGGKCLMSQMREDYLDVVCGVADDEQREKKKSIKICHVFFFGGHPPSPNPSCSAE